jgi:hypothetical protein
MMSTGASRWNMLEGASGWVEEKWRTESVRGKF